MNPFKIIIKNKLAFFIYIFYTLKYSKEENGYYLAKRLWIWLLILPISLIAETIVGVIRCIVDLFGYDSHYIVTKKRKLTFIEKINYTLKLK